MGLHWVRLYAEPGSWMAELVADLEPLVAVLEELGDDAGLARAWRLIAEARQVQVRIADSEAALARAIEHARRAGDEQELGSSMGAFAISALWGSTPAPEGVRRAEAILAEARGRRPNAEAAALKGLAGLRAMQGDFDQARELMTRCLGILERIGRRLVFGGSAQTAGFIELLAGDDVRAEQALRRGLAVLDDLGDHAYRNLVVLLLAHALIGQGRFDEAERYLEEAAAEIEDDEEDIDGRLHLWTGQARLLLARSCATEAEAQARAAVELVAQTDELTYRADAAVVLAEALAASGRTLEAVAALTEATRLYQAKGNQVAAARAQTRLADLGS
jgi:tetratricopeptide (TPR) repeat protein